MPKIRNKARLFSNGQYRKKSGILTRSLKNIIKKNRGFKEFFYQETSDINIKKNIDSDPYNDNNTVFFVKKNVNAVFSVEDKYKANNKVLHSPNEFDTTVSIVNKLVTKKIYDRFLIENHVNNDTVLYRPFNDSTIKDKNDLSGNKHSIDISLNFTDPCRLSFNKATPSNVSTQVTLNNNTYNTHNGNIVYFNFEENKWDYLGNINTNYFNNIDDFATAPIAFNSIETEKQSSSDTIKNQSVGIPITSFGFPYEKKFQAMDRHLFKVKNYISDLFVLESVKIKFKNTNLAETTTSDAKAILNSLNFFILNQRKNLNANSFDKLSDAENSFNCIISSAVTKKTYSETVGGLTNINEDNYDVTPSNYLANYSKIENINQPSETVTSYLGSESNISYTERSASQRELVSYINIVNFSSGSTSNPGVDYENIKLNANYFHEETQTPLDPNLHASVNYTNKEIVAFENVSTPVYHEELERMSSFEIYPGTKYKNRTGTVYRSERSINSDYFESTDKKSTSDDYSVNLKLSNSKKRENPYILHPSDNLVFGFSFNPTLNFQTLNTSKYGKDISILHDNLEISLIGRYYRDEKFISDKRENFYLENTKKVSYKSNLILDDIGMNNIHLNTGAYYDRSPIIPIPLPGGGHVSFYYYNLDSGLTYTFGGTAKPNGFFNYFKIKNENELLPQSINEDNPKLRLYNSLYFNYLSFGQPKDTISYFKFNAYRDVEKKVDVYPVSKVFKNIYFKAVNSTISNNTDRNCKLSIPSPFVE